MKLRLAWLADEENASSYSAREARVLLRALARRSDIVALWFAFGSSEPPHWWNRIRVFPIPSESSGSPDFLKTLIAQQRPHVILTNLPRSAYPTGFEYLSQCGVPWIERINPADFKHESTTNVSIMPAENRKGVGSMQQLQSLSLPYLAVSHTPVEESDEPASVLDRLRDVISNTASSQQLAEVTSQPHLVMRQQLFCNASLAYAMFELTNSLIEMGVPTVPQDEHAFLSKEFIHREENLFRMGAPDKYARIMGHLNQEYDPETAVTIHFSMLRPGSAYSRLGVFHSLGPRDVLYTTGNHTVTPEGVRRLSSAFDTILAPSRHVLRPYLEAGLSSRRAIVIPHGIDPEIFDPEALPESYATEKRFKFLQTSFPWVYDKGFDLTIQAFCRAFSSRDDVCLILRVPRIRNSNRRASDFGQLEALVKNALDQPGAPEILLLEQDVPLSQRASVYTGADCYVFPLRAEGFAMTILEAMACGLPVIATPWSGPADFLSPRYCYTLHHSNPIPERARDGSILRYHVEPDLDHLVNQMRHIFKNRDEAKALGRSAAHVARRQWTWKRAAAKLATVFDLLPEPIMAPSSTYGQEPEPGVDPLRHRPALK